MNQILGGLALFFICFVLLVCFCRLIDRLDERR